MKPSQVPVGPWFTPIFDKDKNRLRRVNTGWCSWLDRYGVWCVDWRNRALFIKFEDEVRFLTDEELKDLDERIKRAGSGVLEVP